MPVDWRWRSPCPSITHNRSPAKDYLTACSPRYFVLFNNTFDPPALKSSSRLIRNPQKVTNPPYIINPSPTTLQSISLPSTHSAMPCEKCKHETSPYYCPHCKRYMDRETVHETCSTPAPFSLPGTHHDSTHSSIKDHTFMTHHPATPAFPGVMMVFRT